MTRSHVLSFTAAATALLQRQLVSSIRVLLVDPRTISYISLSCPEYVGRVVDDVDEEERRTTCLDD